MEVVFSLPISIRNEYLHSLMQTLGCSYICLWAYDATILPNHLSFLDGFYNVLSNQLPSSSLGSVAQQLFNQYRILSFDINDDRVPGLAFRNQLPYLELQQLELLQLSSTEIQTQFYQEARIKVAVFMGCNKGEIELGFLNMSQGDIQTTLRSLFPGDFSRYETQKLDQNNNNPNSSSSSSMRSLSTAGSPEYSSLIFNNIPPGTSPTHFPPDHTLIKPPMRPISSLQQQQQQFPQIHDNDAMILRAIQNVLSTPPSSNHHQSLLPHDQSSNSAFGRYYDRRGSTNIGSNFRRQSLMKRSFSFFRNLNLIRMRDRNQATMRPSSNQIHHMILERRRREKLNENFQALRALLPQGTKKDKASILITAKETLQSLMAEIDKLRKRNEELIMSQKLQPNKESINYSSNEKLNVQIIHVSESSSSEEPRIVNLQVNVIGQISQVDMLIRLLEFLNQVKHVNFVSMDATNTNNAQGNVHQITFRLRITQASEWDEDAFREAVRRVVADLIHYHVDQNL